MPTKKKFLTIFSIFFLFLASYMVLIPKPTYAVITCHFTEESVEAGNQFLLFVEGANGLANNNVNVYLGEERVRIATIQVDILTGNARRAVYIPGSTVAGDYTISVETATCAGSAGHVGDTLSVLAENSTPVETAGENPCSATECDTGLGPISTTVKGLANRILQIGIGLAGGLALILMVIGAIRVLVSGGDQQKLNGGREMLVAAIAGLLFLIFSTLILEFIGLNILKGVPGIGS